jgi:hypothetical protein
MIQNARKDRRSKLCLGYPFLVIATTKVAPLLYVPIEVIEDSEESVILRPDETEISYAALKELKFTEEEIAAFLDDCEALRSDLEMLESRVLLKVDEIYGHALPREQNRPEAGTLWMRPSLFLISDRTTTGNLIRELQELASPKYWASAPESLRILLNNAPEHEYPALPPGADTSIYVKPINPQQAQALHATRSEHIVVVTGPPGTGKSQLVLNTLVDGVIRGQRVLFASRNNKAVDVVMQRLQEEINFRGAVRTGSRIHREDAARQMRLALSQIGQAGPVPDFRKTKAAYETAVQNEIHARGQIREIRRLHGLARSYREERDRYLDLLPPALRRVVQHTPLDYRPREAEPLDEVLSGLLTQALHLRDSRLSLEEKRSHIFSLSDDNHTLLAAVARI